jgi:hypothetical protein
MMHGTMTAIKNRKGRKRKSGRRTASGDIARVAVDYRSMAAAWPDRQCLPEALRTSEKAGSVIGRLNLLKAISDEMYEAGRRYAQIVGAYLSMANAPRGMAGSGRGYDCTGAATCPVDTCVCLKRTQNYNDAYTSVSKAGTPAQGRSAHMALKRAVIFDEILPDNMIDPLKLGLSALARHFGLTNQRKG